MDQPNWSFQEKEWAEINLQIKGLNKKQRAQLSLAIPEQAFTKKSDSILQWTLLQLATARSYQGIALVLVNANPNCVKYEAQEKETALHIAASISACDDSIHPSTFSWFFRLFIKADPTLTRRKNHRGETALQQAIYRPTIVEILLTAEHPFELLQEAFQAAIQKSQHQSAGLIKCAILRIKIHLLALGLLTPPKNPIDPSILERVAQNKLFEPRILSLIQDFLIPAKRRF